jgi:hypothetical protein
MNYYVEGPLCVRNYINMTENTPGKHLLPPGALLVLPLILTKVLCKNLQMYKIYGLVFFAFLIRLRIREIGGIMWVYDMQSIGIILRIPGSISHRLSST